MVRLLAPQDFGLYAVALAANAFLIHVNDMGMIAATVQWRGDIKEMAATARTMAIAFSLGWYALFFAAAPFIADLAHSPDATLLVRLMSLTIIVDGVTSVSVGVIQRQFMQDKLMMAIAIGFVFNAAVCVTLAAKGVGPSASSSVRSPSRSSSACSSCGWPAFRSAWGSGATSPAACSSSGCRWPLASASSRC